MEHVQSLDSLGDHYCSLGYNREYYLKLLKTVGHKYKQAGDILKSLRDVSTLSDAENTKFSEYGGFQASLLRDSASEWIWKVVRNLPASEKRSTQLFKVLEYDPSVVSLFFEGIEIFGINDLIDILIKDYRLTEMYVEYAKSHSKDDTRQSTLSKLKLYYYNQPRLVAKIDQVLQDDSVSTLIKRIWDELIVSDWTEDKELGQYCPIESVPFLIKQALTSESHDNASQKPDSDKAFLRLTNSRQMNDPMEGRVLMEYLGLQARQEGEFQQSSVYLSSATTALDSLPMWKQYAEDATGVILIYSQTFLKQVVNSQGKVKIARTCYVDPDTRDVIVSGIKSGDPALENIKKNLKQIRERVENAKKNKDDNSLQEITGQLRLINFLFKNSSYGYESEYRFVEDLEGEGDSDIFPDKSGSFILPFLYTFAKRTRADGPEDLELQYQKVILGPKAIDADYIGPYLKLANPNLKIVRSKISYR